jgi:hypothetical protein
MTSFPDMEIGYKFLRLISMTVRVATLTSVCLTGSSQRASRFRRRVQLTA